MRKENFSSIDLIAYYLLAISTWGGAFFIKTIMKKALAEMIDERK